MIIEIQSGEGNAKELCILEFQGEILGELPGNKLGRIDFNKVFPCTINSGTDCNYVINSINFSRMGVY